MTESFTPSLSSSLVVIAIAWITFGRDCHAGVPSPCDVKVGIDVRVNARHVDTWARIPASIDPRPLLGDACLARASFTSASVEREEVVRLEMAQPRARFGNAEGPAPPVLLASQKRPAKKPAAPAAKAGGRRPGPGPHVSPDQPLWAVEIPTKLAAFPAWSDDGKRLIGATSPYPREGSLLVWDAEDGTEISNKRGSAPALEFPPPGPNDKRPDEATRKEIAASLSEAIFSPDFKRVLGFTCRMFPKNAVIGWDPEQEKELFHFELKLAQGINPSCFAFSPDGRRFAVGGNAPHLSVHDAVTGTLVRSVELPPPGNNAAQSIAFSPSGKRIATGALGVVRIWDAETGRELVKMPRNMGWREISSLCFSPDGSRVAVGNYTYVSETGEIQVWDATNGAELLTFEGHKKEVVGLAFSPGGRLVASAGRDNSIRLWNAKDGVEVRRIRASIGSQMGDFRRFGVRLVFSPDGKRIALSEQGKPSSLRVWDVSAVALRANEKPSGEGARVAGENKSMRPKGLDMVSRAQPDLRVRSNRASFNTLVYSPDGKRIATASNKTVTLWDASTWAEIQSFVGHDAYVECVAFSSDGKRIVSGSRDRTLRIWDTEKGNEITTLRGHAAEVLCLALSPDGKRIASGGKDNTILISDMDSGALRSVLKGHRSGTTRLAFSPDGRRLASGGGSVESDVPAQVKVWDVATGQERVGIELPKGGVTSLAFSPDGKRIAVTVARSTPQGAAGFGEAKVWDAERGTELFTLLEDEKGAVYSVAYSPDGRRIVTGSTDRYGSIQFFDAENGVVRHKVEYAAVLNVAFSPDGKKLAGWGALSPLEIKIWDASEAFLDRQRLYSTRGGAAGVPVVPPVPIDGPPGAAVRYINPPDMELVGRPLLALKHFAKVRAATFSPDGRYIASVGSSPENWIRIWDGATGRQARVIKGHTFDVSALVFSPDGRRIVSASHDRTMRVWDVETAKELFRLEDRENGPSPSLGFSPDGKLIIGNSIRSELRVWDAATGREIRRITASGRSSLSKLAFSPDGRWVACADGPNTATLISIDEKAASKVFKGHTASVQAVVFSPNGKLVASCSGTPAQVTPRAGEVKLWDAASAKEIRTLARDGEGVIDLAFSPDSKRLAAGTRDHLFKVWEVESGRELMSFRAQSSHPGQDGLVSVAFSPDGKRILGCGGDKYVRVWDANDVQPVRNSIPGPYLASLGSAVVVGPGPTRYLKDWECVAFSPDGRRVVSGASEGEIKIWDVASGRETFTLQPHLPGLYNIKVNRVAFSPDGHLVVSCGDDGKNRVWDADTGRLVRTLDGRKGNTPGNVGVINVAFTPDGRRILSATGLPGNEVRVCETATGNELFAYKLDKNQLHDDGVRSIAFSADGSQFLISCAFKTILFESTTGKPIRDLEGVVDNGTRAVISPDGRRVVSTSVRQVSIVDALTGKQLVRVDAPINTGVSSAPVFSPDGKTFATGGHAGSISLWDAATGKESIRCFDETGPILAQAFSPDGKFLVSGSGRQRSEYDIGTTVRDGEVQLWDAASGELIRTFEPRPRLDEPEPGPGPKPDNPANPLGGQARVNFQAIADRADAERTARALLTQADWKAAAQGYSRMFQIRPIDNGEAGFESAAVLLLAGDKAGYQQRCAELVERSGTASIRSYHMARACTLAPDSVKDFAVPAQKSAGELERSREFWSLTELGALACRAGRFDEAAELLQASLRTDARPGIAVLNWLWLALVEQGRGKPDNAGAWLEKASNWMDKVSPNGAKMPPVADCVHMHNWLEAVILRQEARARVLKGSRGIEPERSS